MISKELYKKVLIDPAKDGADKLFIVSGYATSAMAFHHLQDLKSINEEIVVKLIVGMCPSDGLSLSNHRGFQKLVNEDYIDKFFCSYIYRGEPVHSKAYIWIKSNKYLMSFVGSANYTQNAFQERNREILVKHTIDDVFGYYMEIDGDSIFCTHNDAENFVKIYNDRAYRKIKATGEIETPAIKAGEIPKDELESITVSFLDRDGDLPSRSGLNWGQRPEAHREPNQAYIRLESSIYRSNYFPSIGEHFTVLTDDNKTLICSRAQANGKAIHTPHNNSLIGIYFRNRLGIPLGNPVTKDDLISYGRTNVTFLKIDGETYYLDFSV